MITGLLDCSVKITRASSGHEKWKGYLGQIVNIFISGHSEPWYTVMFEDEAEGILVNFIGHEFVVVLMGDGN